MIKFLFYISTICSIGFFLSCNQGNEKAFNISPAGLDSLKKQGDAYGMKTYTICMLKPGKRRLMQKSEADAIDAGHLSYLKSLADAGTIVLLGFYTTGYDNKSLIIFNSSDTTFARETMLKSPEVAQELSIPHYYNWYGPVALTELNNIHQKITTP